MASALIVPGVQVKTEFEPAPVLPGATGILGLAGVTDYGPIEPKPVGSFGELVSLFGPATRYTMPEARAAFANGVMQIVVARTAPGRGLKASTLLLDDENEAVATLEARAEGTWGNNLAARVRQVRTLSGTGIKYANLELLLDGNVVETLANLVMDEINPNYLFAQVNAQSRLVVAYDPLFEKELPATLARTALAALPASSAFALLSIGNTDVVRVEAKRAGQNGNKSAIRVDEGHYGLTLLGAGSAPSIDISASASGVRGVDIRVAITDVAPNGVNVVISVTSPDPSNRTFGPFADVDALVAGMMEVTDVVVAKTGDALPAVIAATPLARRVTVELVTEGRETATFADLPDLVAVEAISNRIVSFLIVGGATALPDATGGTPLKGGRNAGNALQLLGDNSPEPLLQLEPIQTAEGSVAVEVSQGVSTLDNATGVFTLSIFLDDALVETHSNLTMDPDDPNYLPDVLQESALLRGTDLFVRSRSTNLPRTSARAQAFTGGTSPLVDDYQEALDRLESADEVDLVIASCANQLDGAGVRSVHQAVAAHCAKMAAPARNRIGLGSVTGDATSRRETRVDAILDHADDVRSDAFILTTPAGSEAAVAGLLSLQDYFRSPTFKNVLALGVEAGAYSDAELDQLVGGDVLVVNKKRGLGNIVVKGILTSGRQINVQRTANKAVRDVKAIADVYIGLLNNEGNQNALRQQITALFLQMTRDGALVPSTDGTDPPFKIDVYSTQADFANGIVRIDIAIRPVRAIDFIYATILVQN